MSLSCGAGVSYYSDRCIRHRRVSSVVSRVQSYIISLYDPVTKTACLNFCEKDASNTETLNLAGFV